MRVLLLLFAVLAVVPVFGDEVWILRTGPTVVEGIPLKPYQPVSGWRGVYSDGADQIGLYITQSPHFFPPQVPEVRKLGSTPWTVVVFFPPSWTAGQRSNWLDRWTAEFLTLASLPDPGWPVVFPSVLRKG